MVQYFHHSFVGAQVCCPFVIDQLTAVQQFSIGLFLSGRNGNTELSESDFAR